MKRKKKKVDLAQFIEAKRVLYQLGKLSIKQVDFSCIFTKDLTAVQKKRLASQFDNNVAKAISCFLSLPGFCKEYSTKMRPEIKITHGKNWEYKVEIKPSKV